MSEELKEYFGDLKEYCTEQHKIKTASNRSCSAEILKANGIAYETKNGIHFMIQTAAGRIDFWPGTGLFRGAANGRGIFPLIKAIERIEAAK